jgi:ribosomal protein S3, bacterial type
MGQKINPHGFRVGVIKDWDSRWFEKDEKFGDTLVSDYNIRKTLKSQLQQAGIPKIEIERDRHRVRVFIHCAKPGMVIGRGGSEIDKLRKSVEDVVKMPVSVNVIEVKKPDLNAQLVAENIAGQLERRISFRRAMKQCIARTMKEGAKGIKVNVGGRLGGAEIARSEHYHEGTIPLQTLRADIDYGFWEAVTTYGKIGVKVWIYKGEVLAGNKAPRVEPEMKQDRRDRKPRDNNRGGERRDYNNNNRTGGGNNNRGGGGFNRNNNSGDRNAKPEYKGGNRTAPNPNINRNQGNRTTKEAPGNVNTEES